jgi:3-dehydroquinate synthase
MQLRINKAETTEVVFDFSLELFADLKLNFSKVVFVVDARVYKLHRSKFLPQWQIILVEANEDEKSWARAEAVIEKLAEYQLDKKGLLVGVGGGVITDLVGFVASIYMRGVAFAFVPTTLLAAVDAAIGGKNGVNMGLVKNLIGTITQPNYLLYDAAFFRTLPTDELANGFAEVIKYACILDADLFDLLSQHSLRDFESAPSLMLKLIKTSLQHKARVVEADPLDNGLRRILNFGHTMGHAIEKNYQLKHGFAVAIGMVFAAKLSEAYLGLPTAETQKIIDLLTRYQLPTHLDWDKHQLLNLLAFDKKKDNQHLHFILLKQIGQAQITPIPMAELALLI